MTRGRATSRRSSGSTGGRRSPRGRERRESLIGRLGRTVLAGVLLIVVLLIAASYLGFFGRRDLAGFGEERDSGVSVYQTLIADPDDLIVPAPAKDEPRWRPLRGDAERFERDAPTPRQAGSADAVSQSEEAQIELPVLVRGETDGVAEWDTRPVPAGAPVRVHLANGCGVDRLAAGMRDRFRQAGFDVCGVDNADRSDYIETLVIDRCGDRIKAQAVCTFLRERWGVGRLILQVRSAPMTDVLVVLGPDLAVAMQGPVVP